MHRQAAYPYVNPVLASTRPLATSATVSSASAYPATTRYSGTSSDFSASANRNDEQTSSQLTNAESELTQHLRILVGDHLELDGTNGPETDLLPYEHVRMLGHGGTASVEMVRDVHTGSVYARKVVKNVYSRNMREAKQALLNEVKVMKRLVAHHHVVRVHGTYTKGRELAMILDPVADGGDLASFLQNYRDQGFSWHKDSTNKENLAQNNILRKAPYCLVSALAFIHKQTIRHKDIKPQNILIHRGRVMYTDFGLAYDFGDAGRSTTTGYLQGMTRRYCAPEVIECGSRNSKSDVFSLGCVFIEIYLALADDAEHDQIYRGPYHEAVDSHPNGIPLPCCASFKSRIFALLRAAVPTMMRRDPSLRPSACAVANLIFTDESFNKSPDLCLECSEFSTSVDDNKFLRLLPATI